MVDGRAKIVAELVAEFVEERVRLFPTTTFGVDEVKRALGAALQEAEETVELKPSDDTLIPAILDRHPFLVRTETGRATWKPGLNKAAGRPA